uniref:Uncharacterized protein n=1 Tax=Anopheles dirus TaxID=7168 RepID=A0A182NYJ3_9DIPT
MKRKSSSWLANSTTDYE